MRTDCQYYKEYVVKIWGPQIEKQNFENLENAGYKRETFGVGLYIVQVYYPKLDAWSAFSNLYFSTCLLEILPTCSS